MKVTIRHVKLSENDRARHVQRSPPDHVGAKSGSFQPHLHHLVPQVEHSQILKNFSTTYNTERCHKSILRRLFGQMITPIQLPSLPQDGA